MTRELDCEHAREFIRPEAGPLHPALRGQVEAHIAGCEECRTYLALDPGLRRAYEALRAQRAPEALHNKVVGAVRALQGGELDASRPSPSNATVGGPPLWRYGLMLAAAGPGGPGLRPERRTRSGRLRRERLCDRLRAPGYGWEHLATSDPVELSRFFRERLGVALEPLVFDGLELESGEVCILDGELGALILYKLDGRVLSHYLVPREGTSARPPLQRVLAADETLGMHDAAQVSMVTWASESVEQALVGEAPAEALTSVVSRGTGD